MKNAALAGALVLATAGPSFAGSEISKMASIQAEQHARGTMITYAQIARFKAALRLRPDQEGRWAAVAKVLHSMIRHNGRAEASYGYVGRIGQRAVAFTTSVLELRRLAAAARPLVEVLDDDQKMTALNLVQAMGFGGVMDYF